MPHYLVVLPNWFGEVLFVEPFLRALSSNPGTRVSVLGWPQAEMVLKHHPDIYQFIAFDEKGRDRFIWRKWALGRQLKTLNCDAAFVVRPSFSRALMLRWAGINRRIGFQHKKNRGLITEAVEPPDQKEHKAKGYFRLLAPVGIEASFNAYRYFVGSEERKAIRKFKLNRPFIILHSGANWQHKQWPLERFVQLAAALKRDTGCEIVFTGTQDDKKNIDSAAALLPDPPRILAGQTTLRELAACIEQARLFVSNDTGVMHIASALRRPVVALFGPTAPQITGPLCDTVITRVLHDPTSCPQIPCFDEKGNHPGMRSLSVETVKKACMELLNQGGSADG